MELFTFNRDVIKEIFRDCLKEVLQEKQLHQDPVEQNAPPVTTKELCKYLNVSAPTLHTWRKKKKIPFFRVGTSIRYDLEKVQKALNK